MKKPNNNRGIQESPPLLPTMEGGPPGKRRRGPPASKRNSESHTNSGHSDDAEWFDDIVDQSESEDGGFGGFAVRRPEMSSADQVEGQQLERYFEKKYHGKSSEHSVSIEDDWDTTESVFKATDLLKGHKALLMGVQSFMIGLPMLVISGALVWAGDSLSSSVDGTNGAVAILVMVFLGICMATIALIQMIASSVNQSLREREIARDGPDIPILSWSESLQLGSKIFAEAFLTFFVVWMIEILGLWLLAGGAPSLEMPSIDADNVSLGTILYGLGLFGSIFVMLGMIPYTIEASIKKS